MHTFKLSKKYLIEKKPEDNLFLLRKIIPINSSIDGSTHFLWVFIVHVN